MAPYIDPNQRFVVEIFVRRLKDSIAFYGAFGFRLVREEARFAELAFEDQHLLFLHERTDLPPVPPPPQANIRVIVQGVDELWNKAKEMGAKIVEPIQKRPSGLRDFTIADPDGFGLKLAAFVWDQDE
jgi:catechol 2,3-dioxygenase-like lactoylglutathione lyase family enzyme